MHLYSSRENAFYNSEVNTNIPDDAVEISREKLLELLNGQSAGKSIASDSSGYPVLTDHQS